MQSLKIYIASLLVCAILMPYIGGLNSVLAIDTLAAERVTPIVLEEGESNIDENLYQAIYKMLEKEGRLKFKSENYYIDSVNREGSWALISVSKLNKSVNTKFDGTFLGEGALILASTPDNGLTWELSFEKESNFKDKLATAPDTFLSKASKEALSIQQTGTTLNSTLALAATSIYKFPWPELNTRTYTKGWHGTTIGLDLGSSSTNRTILASGAGIVTRVSICTYSVNVTVKNNDGTTFNYLHLNKSEFDSTVIKNGVVIPQGKKLGKLRTGTFSDNCGYTIQNAGYSHIHWGLPTNVTNTIDQWSIKYTGNCWSKAGYANRCVGSSFGSTNKEVV